MGVNKLRSDSVAALLEKRTYEEQRNAAAAIAFVVLAESGQIDETTISEYPTLFVQWDENWRGKAGDIVQDEGQLYRSIHDVKDAGQNTKPSATPSMWTRIGNPLEEFPEWVRPIGAHDTYDQGAKVTHSGKRWVSNANDNVWEPGVYGWDEYQEPEPAQESPQEAQDGPGEPSGE